MYFRLNYKFFTNLKVVAFVLIFIFTFFSSAEEFLNTNDIETYSIIHGNGQERGFYFQVNLFIDEETLPKTSLLPGFQPTDETLLNKKLIDLEPYVEFTNNSAECAIFQIYYTTDDLTIKGTNITYAYLITVKNSVDKNRCTTNIYTADKTLLIRKIEYFASSGEK